METNESSVPKIKVKAYSTKEVARIYQVSEKTLRKWMTSLEPEIGHKRGRYYNPRQTKLIFDKFGLPE